MGGGLLVIGIIVIGFMLFCVYFIFKQIEFVVVSVNLYRRMVHRQDAMVKLLVDIRDNTKNYTLSPSDDDSPEDDAESAEPSGDQEGDADPGFCFHCGEELPGKVPQCPKCGKKL